MRARPKHAATDEAIEAVDRLEAFEVNLIAILKAYKRGDLLSDVCAAREETLRLRDAVDEIVKTVAFLADREVAARALALDSPTAPAQVATPRG